MINRRRFSACLAVLLIGASAPWAIAQVADLSPTRYFNDIKFLASPQLRGRGNGSPELEKAADYIAAEFRAAGLKPAGEDGTFFQKFEVTTGADLGAKNELVIAGTPVKINDDFVPILFSDTAAFDGPMIFAGYGIT